MSGLPQLARTPVERLERTSRALGVEVWVKREELCEASLGGSKARKLAPLLADAIQRGATDLLTIGAVGSNHVLATSLHGKRVGLAVHAGLVPHPGSPAVALRLEAAHAAGARLLAAPGEAAAAALIGAEWLRLCAQGRRPVFIPPGGTNLLGTRGILAAGRELADQISRGDLPGWPDALFCALGSGGTTAGLLAALAEAGAPTTLHAVRIYPSRLIGRAYLSALARAALGASWPDPLHACLAIDDSCLGGGYGAPTAEAQAAAALFAEDGVVLDPTYTGKAAAALVGWARGAGRGKRALFWSSAPAAGPAPALVRAPLSARLVRLMR